MKYIILTASIILVFSCDKHKFSGSSSQPPAAAVVTPAPTAASTAEVKPSVQPPEFRFSAPALALKRPSCILCHASVVGDVVTDFNIDTNPITPRTDFTLSDSFRPISYNSSNIDGNLIVPAAPITGNYLAEYQKLTPALPNPLPIKLGLTMPFWSEAGSQLAVPFPTTGANRDKTKPGVNDIIEKANLKVTPPTEAEIANLGNLSTKKVVIESQGQQVFAMDSTSAISGLSFVQGDSAPFVKNTVGTALSCNGDILITSSLVLDGAEFKTAGKDCRIYVGGTIFIKDSLIVSDGSDAGMLQLASGRAILSGLKYGRGALVTDLVFNDMKNVNRFTVDSGYSSYVMRRKSDNKLIAYTAIDWNRLTPTGATPKTDADIQTARRNFANAGAGHWIFPNPADALNQQCSFGADNLDLFNGPAVPCSVVYSSSDMAGRVERGSPKYVQGEFRHVLLATPLFLSRQEGNISGAIIADLAVGVLGDFKFNSDPRIKSSNVFPLFKRRLVEGLE